MAIAYCEYCHKYIDIDYEAEHFNDEMVCIVKAEDESNE